MSKSQSLNMPNKSFNAIWENKLLVKISEFTEHLQCGHIVAHKLFTMDFCKRIIGK